LKEAGSKKKKKIYEGKAKILYETDNEDLLVQEFKNDATAFDGKKKGTIKGKGPINNEISAHLFTFLESYHIPTHFVRLQADNSMVIKKLTMIPLEVVVRNVATGSYVKRYNAKEGKPFEQPLTEFFLKDDAKHDPIVTKDEILAAAIVTPDELRLLQRYAQKINAVLKAFFVRRKIALVDFKLEFGRTKSGKVILGDEISPDTCRLWDTESGEKMDKDRFRHDLGKVEEAYREVHDRVFKEV